jgi:dihydroorotate dehydrogenase electron transfer subunit
MSVDPAAGSFTVFLKTIGPGTRALGSLVEGECAQCLGPLGHPFSTPPEGTGAVFVAGGYGVAPFYFFARVLGGSRPARLFYGGRTSADLVLLSRFDGLLPVQTATEDGSHGARGYVTRPLDTWLDDERGAVQLYACGPHGMMQAVAGLGQRRGLPTELSLDPFMGCGVGTCLACVVRTQKAGEPRWKYRCACTEGPVFDAAEVVWPGEEMSAAGARGDAA